MEPLQRRDFLAMAAGLGLLALSPSSEPQEAKGKEGEKALEPLLAELEAQRGRYQNVPRADGQFLNLLTKVARARRVLEVGTSTGYSAIWFCLALEETDGHLTTIEIDPQRLSMARENLKRAGLSHRVTFLEGDAHRIVPTLEGPFDLVFLDADKGREHDYFGYLYPEKVPPGSLILVHNAIRFRKTMQRYFDLMAAHPEFDMVVLSLTMEDGLAVSYRRRG